MYLMGWNNDSHSGVRLSAIGIEVFTTTHARTLIVFKFFSYTEILLYLPQDSRKHTLIGACSKHLHQLKRFLTEYVSSNDSSESYMVGKAIYASREESFEDSKFLNDARSSWLQCTQSNEVTILLRSTLCKRELYIRTVPKLTLIWSSVATVRTFRF